MTPFDQKRLLNQLLQDCEEIVLSYGRLNLLPDNNWIAIDNTSNTIGQPTKNLFEAFKILCESRKPSSSSSSISAHSPFPSLRKT